MGKDMKPSPKPLYPLMVVLASISLIEVAMTFMYPRLEALWERIITLPIIVIIPLAIIGTFLYLWVYKPGHLYPPSEFGTGKSAERKLVIFDTPGVNQHDNRGLNEENRNDDNIEKK